MVKRTATLFGIFAVVLGATAFAIDPIADVTLVARRAPSEVAVDGITPEAFFEQQRELHDWLLTQLPEGAEKATVSVAITDADRASIATPDATAGAPTPMRVGVVKSLADRVGLSRGQSLNRLSKAATGVQQEMADGGFVWATTISSPGAVGLRVHFEDFSLPADAEMYIFSQEGEAHGPYVGSGPDDTGEFWSNSVRSSTAVVMLKYYGTPDATDLRGLSFTVTEVAHVAIDFPSQAGEGGIASFCTYNASCVVNNACTSNPAVNDAEGAVAKMRWISGAFVYICSGGLLADTDPGSQIPYFLTANHCISRAKDSKNLETFFQYTANCGTTNCPSSFGQPFSPPSTLGSSVVATSTGGDFTLLQLSQAPPAGSVFMGWNSSPIANTNGANLYRVSHPQGAPQAFSAHQVDTGAVTCQGWPRGERIYSNDVAGATEGGSSGSPVVNAAGEVVGQLSGCCGYNCNDVCDTASNSTVDGAFAYYWPSVAPYLDPTPCVPSTENCTNGTDDDCDGLADCSDPDCSADPACQGGCGGNGASCSSGADCCSGNCKRGSCKGG